MKPDFLCNVVRRLAKAIGSDTIVEPSARVGITAIPSGTEEFSAFRRDYLLYNITRKLERPGDAARTRRAAWSAFQETERLNRLRNTNILAGVGLVGENDLILRLIRARGIISRILGEFKVEEVLRNCHFTNGASTSRTRASACVELKTIPTWDSLNCTRRAYPYFQLHTKNHCIAYAEAVETGLIRDVSFHEYARWDSVPKDSEVDRSIIIGNDINVFLQRGCGIYIRDRLLRYGIDLTDQSRNQELARMASITDELVTHDAVDSSNRIVTECVAFLLPEEWFDYMSDISERWVLGPDGTRHRLELFSSMGNGFTFELQSLIYFGLAVACSEHHRLSDAVKEIGVFGDDVVLPNNSYDRFLKCITFFGMEANPRKTFRSGPFRESCGAHWYNGRCVAPFYIREPFTRDDPRPVIKFINELRDWYYGPDCESGDPAIDAIITDCIQYIGKQYRNTVPLYMGTTSGVHFNHPLLRPIRKRVKHMQLRLVFKCISEKSKKRVLRSDCDLPWYLYVLWSGNLLDGRRFIVEPDGWELEKCSHPVGRVDMHGLPWAKVHGGPGGLLRIPPKP